MAAMAAERPIAGRGLLYEYVQNLLEGVQGCTGWLNLDKQAEGSRLDQDVSQAFEEHSLFGAPQQLGLAALQSVPTPQRNLMLIRQQRKFGEQLKKLKELPTPSPSEARRPVPTAPVPLVEATARGDAAAKGGEMASQEALPLASGNLSQGSAEPAPSAAVERAKEAVPPPRALATPAPVAAAAVTAPVARAPSPRVGASAAATTASTANARAPTVGTRVQEMKKMFEAQRQPTPPVGRPGWAPLRSTVGSVAASEGPAPSEEGESAAGGAVAVGNQASASALLSEGRRREDIPVPKSIRAAEQSKLHEERRQREREQREREQRDLQKASIVATAKQAMTGHTGSFASVGGSTGSAALKMAAGAKAKAAAAAPARKEQRRSAVLCPEAEASSAREAAPEQQQQPPQPQAPPSAEEPAPAPVEPDVTGPLRERPLNVNGPGLVEGDVCSSPRAKPSRSATSPQDSWRLLRKMKLDSPRQEDNYEISEPEEEEGSDADDNERAKRRAKKNVPRWCKDYMEALSKQADVDPDTILGCRVPGCDLVNIFPDRLYEQVGKSRPKRVNGSSQDWRRDRLTKHEIFKYKEKMGQTKVWTVDVEDAENVAPAPYKSPRPRAGADAGGA
mmetsp:Transcript_68561/g.146683  ORF Transcript_68561/g.146683 Transcript_68561/m.146683 type:complete len:620 (-) Transcript_68561:94-1953(-)